MVNNLDKIILNRIQTSFPIVRRPFKFIALELGISEKKILFIILRLKSEGYIRRIGGNFVPGKIGFVSTLCSALVPQYKIDMFITVINSFKGVTHNYMRENNYNGYNIWFTFIARSNIVILESLNFVSKKTGVKKILNLPALNVYKISAKFTL